MPATNQQASIQPRISQAKAGNIPAHLVEVTLNRIAILESGKYRPAPVLLELVAA